MISILAVFGAMLMFVGGLEAGPTRNGPGNVSSEMVSYSNAFTDGDDGESTYNSQTAATTLCQRRDVNATTLVSRRTQNAGKKGAVTGLVLVNAKTRQDIIAISDGDVVDISDLGKATPLTIRAETIGTVGSVEFDYCEYTVDSSQPYTLAYTVKNTPSMAGGVPQLSLNGKQTIIASAREKKNGNGPKMNTISVTFTIIGSAADPCEVDLPKTVLPSKGTDVPAYTASTTGSLNGELRMWHKITLGFRGPRTCERANPNPFTYYRLDITFSHPLSGTTYMVPGYYAGDGNAANTGATSGNVWLVHFSPDHAGRWAWSASFTRGVDVAQDGGGSAAGFFHGASGSFEVEPTNKSGRDHRGKGRLEYVGEHHLRFAGTGEWFLKAGADSPESFLSYDDFDGTPNFKKFRKSWSPHARDYASGDPTWGGGRGTEIIGAVNYLSAEGMNVFSFLPFNSGGDDRNVFPHVSAAFGDDQLRMDVSKLAQWEVLFEHADHMGMYLHFKTQEQENDQRLDGGALGPARKLFYRELIARFSHHLALNWNLGEENTNTLDERLAFAEFFENNDPYGHICVLHTGSHVYTTLVGSPYYDGASIPNHKNDKSDVFELTLEWVDKSAKAGRKWVVACDEQASATDGVVPDDDDPDHDVVRKNVLWGNIMAGGAGVEYYFGYAYPCNDLSCEDFRTRANMWALSRYALEFFSTHNVPFWTMSNANNLVSKNNWCLTDPENKVIVVYLKAGGTATVKLLGDAGTLYSVRWYDPRNGGRLQEGSVATVAAGNTVSFGTAPSAKSKDWVVLLDARTPGQDPAPTSSTKPKAPSTAPDPPARGSSSGPFLERKGLVVMEMESERVQPDWVFETKVKGYTGSGYHRMNGNTVYSGDPNGRTSFFIKIQNAGQYWLAIRSNKNNKDSTLSNDCYTKMVGHPGYQGGDTKTYMFGPSNTWRWSTTHQVKHDDHRNPIYTLSAGVHELQISGRAKNFFIDRIVLYNTKFTSKKTAIALQNAESPRSAAPPPPPPMPSPQPTRMPVNKPTMKPAPEPTPTGGVDGAYRESNGLVVMEMESQPIQPDWVFESDLPVHGGSGYYRMDGNTYSGGDPNGRISFFIEITNPGRYWLLLRSTKKTQLGNDCYTKMVGATGYRGQDVRTYLYGPPGTWRWSTTHEITSNMHRTPYYSLSVGVHELQISGKAKGFAIDRVVLYRQDLTSKKDAIKLSNSESPRVAVGQGTSEGGPGSMNEELSFDLPTDFDNAVLSGEPMFFNDGKPVPSGTYRIEYVDGCMKYHTIGHGWTVNGARSNSAWWLVTDDDPNNIAKLGNVKMPGTEGFIASSGGAYVSFLDCVNANKAIDPITFKLESKSTLGVWLAASRYDNKVVGVNGRYPVWKLTLLAR